jgi:HEAT repeat protein
VARLVIHGWKRADSFEDRFRILTLAGSIRGDEGVLRLVSRVASTEDDEYLRAQATEALGEISGPDSELIDILQEASRHERVRVRLAAARSLGRVSSPRRVSPLRILLTSDPWPVVRAAAAESLAPLGRTATRDLVGALSDPSPLVQERAATFLGRLGGEGALRPLSALAEEEDATVPVREAAARALGATCSMGGRDALISLVEAGRARDNTPEDARIGAAAAAALGTYEGAQVTELLIEAAGGGAPGLRLAAIEALGFRGGEPAERALRRLAEDPLPPLRAAAAAALRRIAASGAPAPRCPD